VTADLPSGTVTFLFTDIEGSTKIAQAHRSLWDALQARHHAILQGAMTEHGGHVFQIVGDAFCVAFNTAAEALEAAIAAQRALQSEPWGESPIKVRMGIHTGTAQAGGVEDKSGGYRGYSALARTQRVMSTGYGGQVLLSNTTADLLLGELPADVTLRDMKEHRLKGLVNPEHLWQLMAPDLERDFPALQTLDNIPNNLPLQLTGFIGREKEITEIQGLITTHRLVTLTGSGGVGKTRHALQVGAELLDAFPDGVWLVDLAPVTNPELVRHAMATALRIHAPAARPLGSVLQDYLETKRLLLVLDNCEHLLGACAELADALLHSCPLVKILASSREPLAMAGEITFRVGSLALPDPGRLPALEALTQYDSVRLFIERAVAARPEFTISNENAPAVAQVCARLDGIPLAIELAAARVKGLSVEQIAQRLDERFKLLTGGDRTALPRHQTLRAMIEWSYDLLTGTERVVFRRLAVFHGDWTLEAAEALCGEGPGDAAAAAVAERPVGAGEVMDILLRLVDRSLVQAEERGAQARYRLLETIGELAREKLAQSGEETGARARHLDFFLRFAEESAPKLLEAQPLVWLNKLGAEYENLRAALAWANASPGVQEPARLARANEHLADVRLRLGIGTQALPLYQQALELWARVPGADPMLAVNLHGKIIRTVIYLHLVVDVDTYDALVEVASASSVRLEQALKGVEREPPRAASVPLLATLSEFIGWIRVPTDWDLAARYAGMAVEMAEKLDAPAELSAALEALDHLYMRRGLWRERVSVSRRRLEASRLPRVKDARSQVSALFDYARALMGVGEYAPALASLVEAERLAVGIQDVDLENGSLAEQVHCLLRLDRWDEVLNLENKLLDMQQRYPQERIGPSCYHVAAMASIHAYRGEREAASAQREEAQAVMTSISGPVERWNRFQHY
jgi:predicted ATPase/class 3 adenylate cyclase